jgi:hypothetical protein
VGGQGGVDVEIQGVAEGVEVVVGLGGAGGVGDEPGGAVAVLDEVECFVGAVGLAAGLADGVQADEVGDVEGGACAESLSVKKELPPL